jgi:hypothetical protein
MMMIVEWIVELKTFVVEMMMIVEWIVELKTFVG